MTRTRVVRCAYGGKGHLDKNRQICFPGVKSQSIHPPFYVDGSKRGVAQRRDSKKKDGARPPGDCSVGRWGKEKQTIF